MQSKRFPMTVPAKTDLAWQLCIEGLNMLKGENRHLFEAWMNGHCWSLQGGWDAERDTYPDLAPRILWAAWSAGTLNHSVDVPRLSELARTPEHAWPEEALLHLASQIGAGVVKLSHSERDRQAFEGWVRGQGWSLEDGWDGLKAHYRNATLRILWSAWRDREILRRLSPFASAEHPVGAYLASLRVSEKTQAA